MLCAVQKGQRHRSLELRGQATVTLDLCLDTGTLDGLTRSLSSGFRNFSTL